MAIFQKIDGAAIYTGDCLEVMADLPEETVQLVLTSPPYNVGWTYDAGGGDRKTSEEYRAFLRSAFSAISRVLRPGGVLALNLPMSTRTPKERAFPLASWAELELRESGYLLRESITWVKSTQKGLTFSPSTAIGGGANPYS